MPNSVHQSCRKDPYAIFFSFDLPDYGVELYLTPFIRTKRIAEAREKGRVKVQLKNEEEEYELLESYSGFLTVDTNWNSNLYFWFFPAQEDPENAPIILWLQGGPGSSSLIGLFNEHGPYYVDTHGDICRRRSGNWTLNHSIIYLDNPVGAGFSYTDSAEGYAKNQDNVSDNLYEALQQFFTLFPEFATNSLYLGGQSYAGKYIPSLGQRIHLENSLLQDSTDESKKLGLNFRGIMIGSPFTDPFVQLDWGQHLFNFGLVDEFGKEIMDREMERMREFILKENWTEAFQVMNQTLLDYPLGITTHYKRLTGITSTCNFLDSAYPQHFYYYRSNLQKESTRRSLHIGQRCLNTFGQTKSTVFSSFGEDFPKSAKPELEKLLEQDYKVLLFSSQLDVVIPFSAVENLIKNLSWPGAQEYKSKPREIWHCQGPNSIQVPNPAGYVKEVRNLTYVFIRNAGHMAVTDQPEACFDMVTRFTRGVPFNTVDAS